MISNEHMKETKHNNIDHDIREFGYEEHQTCFCARPDGVRHPLERSRLGWSEPALGMCHLHHGASSRLRQGSH